MIAKRFDKIRAIDLFCGAGGFTKAAQNLGVNVVAGVEVNKHACNTYRNNFVKYKRGNKPKLYENDILKLDPNTVLDDLSLKNGQLDILMGGPPCQGFSSHRLDDECVDDPRNKLLKRYFEFVRVLKPKIFIVENVSGLLWPRHKKHINKFYRLARRSGYKVYAPVVLDAKDFGVPQNRKRVFILGKQKELNLKLDWPPTPTHFNPERKEVKEEKKPAWLVALTVFKKPISNNDLNNIHMNHTKVMVKVFKSTPKNGGSRSQSNRRLPCHKKHNGHKDVYGRIDPSKPGPTMTTGCNNPSKGRFLHPTRNHGITIRHAARFQAFPDSFVFSGGLMAAGKQVGNAVPIKLGETVLETITKAIGAV